MTNHELCLSLMRADVEEEVIEILEDAEYWANDDAWRLFDDNPNNYSTIGNQQSRSEAALIEKLVNAVDARLVNACLEQGLGTTSPDAPDSIKEAVATFFEGSKNPTAPDAGKIRNWTDQQRTAEARFITIASTGMKPEDGGYPSITIVDQGEGQVPRRFPETFLSLNRQNKLSTRFVQGKFNMGGTGALRFCGSRKLQLVVSRRNPSILEPGAPEQDQEWGFTIVRREPPTGSVRSSTYTYLAPVGSAEQAQMGHVLSFNADSLPLFPEDQEPYARHAAWGSLIKLYEYEMKGYRSNVITSGAGLLRRIDLLLPELALPIRIHECRPYTGKKGSFETNITGLSVRLDDDRAQNLEPGFPTSAKINVMGESLEVSIYAFKAGKAKEYRLDQGVLLSVNGQAHGHFSSAFFRRKKVGFGYLDDSLFVSVDCSEISGEAREDLFLNSRDRLGDVELKHAIERDLQELLRNHDGLRELQSRRRSDAMSQRIEDTQPLRDILEDLLSHSPTLRSLFISGTAIRNPFAPKKVSEGDQSYEGKRFPSFFRMKGVPDGQKLDRKANLGQRARITFETDAANDYFSRDIDRGLIVVEQCLNGEWREVSDYSVNLLNGLAYLNLTLATHAVVGDIPDYRVLVDDADRFEPFENLFSLEIQPESRQHDPKKRNRRKPRSKDDGTDRESPGGLALPEIEKIIEEHWPQQSPPFDKYTALKITIAGPTEDGKGTQYDFKVNVDNLYLKAEKKGSREPKLVEQRFVYGLVIIGLALLNDSDRMTRICASDDGNDLSIEGLVAAASRALAPVVVPLIDQLGELTLDE